MPSQGQAVNGLYTLTPSTNNDSSPPGTLPSPRHTMKRTFEEMKNGVGKPHVPGAASQNAADATLTPVQTPPEDPPADPRPGPGKEKGAKAVYDPTFDPALSSKEKQKYKAKYKVFGAEVRSTSIRMF
jgi:[histone H3]-lysine4 N-trimethyltransferase SETD1